MMIRKLICHAVALAILSIPGAFCWAQNVVGYSSIPNPYLLLLREPAVHDELRLNDKQKRELFAANEEIDGTLVAMRNWPSNKQSEKFNQLVTETQSRMSQILDRQQRQRLGQIMLRLRGIRSVLNDKVVERLKLSATQTKQIEEHINQTQEETEQLRKQLNEGKSRQTVEKEATDLREREQKKVLAVLTSAQRNEFGALLGRTFDPSRLGRVSFKAPELVEASGWVNSQPFKISDLKGKVIALHFLAFG